MAWIREQCRAHHGPLASVGSLELGPDGLDFQPEGSLDKLVGLPPVKIPLGEIDDVRLEGLERMLHVVAGGAVWRFAGGGARRVGRVLSLVLRHEEVHRVMVSSDAQLDEQGRVDVFVKDARIALVEASAPLDAPWDRMDRDVPVRTRGLPARLVIGRGARQWTLSGPGVHKLAAVLLMPQGHERRPVFIEGSQQSGLLAHPGLIAIGGGGVVFAPSGLLDQLIGQTPEAWPWQELRSIELRRGGVVFGMVDGPVILASHDADSIWGSALAALDEWMSQRADEGRAWTEAPDRGTVDRPMDHAPALISGDSEHELLAVNMELYSHQIALHMPASPRVQRVGRTELVRTREGGLRLGDQVLRVPLPVRNRWGLGASSGQTAKVGHFARLVDGAGRVLITADTVHTEMRLGMICASLPGRPPRDLCPGLPIRLELSGAGVQDSHTGVAVALLGPAEDQSGWRLLLATGRGAEKAAALRPLSPTLEATVARMGTDGGIVGTAMPAEVLSLARGGCELRLAELVQRGAQLRVVLELPSGARRLSARVDAASRRGGRHQSTLSFIHIDEATLSAIDAVVVSADFAGRAHH